MYVCLRGVPLLLPKHARAHPSAELQRPSPGSHFHGGRQPRHRHQGEHVVGQSRRATIPISFLCACVCMRACVSLTIVSRALWRRGRRGSPCSRAPACSRSVGAVLPAISRSCVCRAWCCVSHTASPITSPIVMFCLSHHTPFVSHTTRPIMMLCLTHHTPFVSHTTRPSMVLCLAHHTPDRSLQGEGNDETYPGHYVADDLDAVAELVLDYCSSS